MAATVNARVWARPRPDAPVVVLVHGLVVSGRYLAPLARELAAQCRVLAPDLPGFGATPGPRVALDVRGLALALAGWLERERLAPCAVLGHSFGCQVAAELAARSRGPVRRLVLVSPTVDPDARSLVRLGLRWLPEGVRDASMAPLVLADLVACGPRRALATARAMVEHRIEDALPRIAVPTLVVGGERDPVAPPGWTRHAAELLPGGRHELVAGGRHALNWHAPAGLAGAVLPFLLEGA